MAEQDITRNYLTTTQVARLLSVSPDTVLKWVKAGKISSHRTLGGHFRIPASALKMAPLNRSHNGELTEKDAHLATYEYCWEHLAGVGPIRSECTDCITYRSRSRRCYELRKLPEEFGCLRVYCQSDCTDCAYYHMVQDRGISVIVLSENPKLLHDRDRLDQTVGMELRFTDSEYGCSLLIESFRPDYIVVDCSLGKVRTAAVCQAVFDDPRIPIPRIVLASKSRKLKEYCDKEIFGWITRPFRLHQLKSCIEGVA